MSVDPTANKEQGSVHWCGVARHLLTTTLFAVGVFRQGVQSMEICCSIRQLWPNLKFTQQNQVLGFSPFFFIEESLLPFFAFSFALRKRSCSLCAQPKFELCKCQTLLVWPLQAKSSQMHCGEMLLRVQMTRGSPESLRGRSKLGFRFLRSLC